MNEFVSKANAILFNSIVKLKDNANIYIDHNEAKKYIWNSIYAKINNKKSKLDINDYEIFPKGISEEGLEYMIKYFDSFIEESLKNLKKNNLI